MKIYQVGGFVRDTLLGFKPKDIDYVVVGSTPAEMEALGYTQVGADFPVFLHPQTCDEYALARKERKTGVGYAGFEAVFDTSITLEDDLLRRDLTINSMAFDMDTGELIDPYGGQADLKLGTLRATSPAFAEDPVRVLRTARFAARYNFSVAGGTVDMMRTIMPEIRHVPQERVWAEMEKGLMEANPYRMFKVLQDCGALDEWGPLHEYSRADMDALKKINPDHSLAVRFGLVSGGFDTPKAFERCRIPTHPAMIAYTCNKFFRIFQRYSGFHASARVNMLESIRAFSNPALLQEALDVWSYYENLSDEPPAEETAKMILADWINAKSVDAGAIAAACSNKAEIKSAIHLARCAAI